jgi:protein-S-isoprenylcysteine O-methyltransferase Ste14
VKLEEQLLIERYGKSYEDYKEKVKKFFPFVY